MPAKEFRNSEEGKADNAEEVELPNGQVWKLDGAENGLLGKGRFGIVQRCFLRGENAAGACKTVQRPSDVFDAACLDKEIKILQYICPLECTFDGLVRIHGVRKTEDQTVHIVMELCTGGDLFQRIQENNANGRVFSEDEAAEVMLQIMESIAFCHSKGIAHRDIKAENILFTDKVSRRVKIGDFGQAAFFSNGESKMKGVVGTPYYIAPEILEGNEYSEKIDSPKEIFSSVVRARLCFRSHMSFSVKSLLRLMLNRQPSVRPSAAQILGPILVFFKCLNGAFVADLSKFSQTYERQKVI